MSYPARAEGLGKYDLTILSVSCERLTEDIPKINCGVMPVVPKLILSWKLYMKPNFDLKRRKII